MCICHKCGRDYRVDILVPDSLWEAIRPDKDRPVEVGLLCGPCISEAIEQLGEYGSYTLVTNPTNNEQNENKMFEPIITRLPQMGSVEVAAEQD